MSINDFNDFSNSIVMNTDGYKPSHIYQYPENTEYIFDYVESRGGKYDYTLFFGIQMFLKEYMDKPVTRDQVLFAKDFFAAYGAPFAANEWMKLVDRPLPLRIRAVPEGTIVPTKRALVTVENTEPGFGWLVSYVETSLLRAVWYPTTVATQSFFIRQILKGYLEKTGDVAGLDFKLHDFGARGVSSFESAAIGGAAHLATGAKGSDTVSGVLALMKYYNAPVSGFSIPAAEHSTTTILGREGEAAQYKRILDQFAKPGALVAIVSDGYDIYNACTNIWGKELKQQVIDSGATVIIRPDSGHPATVVLGCLQRLADAFGFTINAKGYKVLNNVRVIQGDGINEDSIKEICDTFIADGFSADNVAFGMGGALLQIVNRDTQRFAMKASAAKINGEWIDVYKDPITDPGKASKKGRLNTVRNEIGEIVTLDYLNSINEEFFTPLMRDVWVDGELIVDDNLEIIRSRSNG
jgi:nicotinamide phosphoribosyltransferase